MDEEIQLGQLVDQLRNAQDPIASYAGRMEELIHVMEGFDIPYDPRHHATPDQHVRVERGMEYLQELTGNNPDQRLGPEAILQMLVEMRILAI